MIRAGDFLIHAARFSLDRLDWMVGDMRRRLGLGLLPCLPFLARRELQGLTRFLAYAEPLMRRLIVLLAAELGALQTYPSTAHGTPAPKRATGPVATPRLFPAVHFRLTEAEPGKTRRTPPPKRFRTGPRIRLLDEETPVDLSEYRAEPFDILPAARQVRRFLALEHAMDNLPRYVEAMRRLMGQAIPILTRALPPAFSRLPVTRAEETALIELHDVAVRECPDTS